jgi:predicted component of type VI protein secretion system
MPYLELEGSSNQDAPRELSGDTIVGSGSQAGWRLHNFDLAARHFRVRISSDGSCTVAPCSSQNVVVVNGAPASSRGEALSSGDAIAAGSARFIFLEQVTDPRPAPSAAPEPAFLLDGSEGVGYPLEKRVTQVGREIGCAVVLRDPTVSRFHADIRAEAGEFVLYSMGSSGTLVNGNPVNSPKMLVPRDQIRIGSSTLSFIRGSLPTGVKIGSFDPRKDAAIHRRPTMTGGRAISARAAMGNPLVMAAIAAAALAMAVVLYLLL